MDRIDAMKVFVAALEEGSMAAAGRKLGRSPAAVSRAIAYLEDHVGTALLHRTTRMLRLSTAGEQYALACRRIVNDLEEAEREARGENAMPRGSLTLNAPTAAGEEILRPIVDAFIDATPTVSVRLHFVDRQVNLIDDGVDVALRIAHLADSSLVAIRVGEARRVVAASPRYLASRPKIERPSDLREHETIAMWPFDHDAWRFPAPDGGQAPQTVQFKPRLSVNNARAAAASAAEGHGVTRLFSYHVAPYVHEGSLAIILDEHEQPPLPVYLLTPYGRLAVPKVRAFVDFAAPRLKAYFARVNDSLRRAG